MTQQTLSQYSLKGEADALALTARANNQAMTHGQALEVVSKRHGFKSWRAAKAMLPPGGAEDTAPGGEVQATSADAKPSLSPTMQAFETNLAATLPGPSVLHSSIDPRFGFAPESVIGPLNIETRQAIARYYENLRALGVAAVVHHPLRGDVFIDATIEGRRFQAVTGRDPYIYSKAAHGSVAYGVSEISHTTDQVGFRTLAGWAICKYRDQPHIWLEGLSPAGLRALAIEFGLRIGYLAAPDLRAPCNEALMFYGSRAYGALVAWAKAHPRKIGASEPNSYLGHWAMAAATDAGLPLSRSHKSFLELDRQSRAKLVE